MPLRQRIHSYLTRYATHLRVASFVAAIAIFLYLANPWHTLLLTLQTVVHYFLTNAIPAILSAIALALLGAAIPYQHVKLPKLTQSARYWLIITPFILISVALLYWIPQANVDHIGGLKADEKLTHIETERKDLGALILSIFGAYGLFLTWRRIQTTEQGHITDRYSKAIELLGAMKQVKDGYEPHIEVRLGAIYALERIAWDSPRDHWTIMEVLTAYIRENAPAQPETTRQADYSPNFRPPTVIKAILDVLKRRHHENERQSQNLNLTATNLRGANLIAAPLQRADLSNASLQGAKLMDAQLQGASLARARMRGADLSNAKLQGATGIRVDQIMSADFWQAAEYDPQFRQKLGVPDKDELNWDPT